MTRLLQLRMREHYWYIHLPNAAFHPAGRISWRDMLLTNMVCCLFYIPPSQPVCCCVLQLITSASIVWHCSMMAYVPLGYDGRAKMQNRISAPYPPNKRERDCVPNGGLWRR